MEFRKRPKKTISKQVSNLRMPVRNVISTHGGLKTAIDFLAQSGKTPRILVKIAKNLGDTIHGQPIIRHYRNLYKNAAIVFMVEEKYKNAHEYDPNIDKIITLPNGLDNKARLELWHPLKNNKDIDIAIIPAINPFQALYKENAWCHKNIADQYFHNANILDLKPIGGREILIKYDQADNNIAEGLTCNLDKSKLIALEYNSYSTRPVWKPQAYTSFVQLAARQGYRCISIAAKHEPLIPDTIDCRGISWRQTVALLSRVPYVIGCGSGITVLAAAARPQPKILELDIPEDVTIAGCGYAPGILLKKPTPESVIKALR